jgi:ABC-2 type transport system ATP-binding protein
MLEILGLQKRYGDVVALDDASLTARPGRLLGFLGPNGSGKTTTMRAVFGLIQLDAGEVRWRQAAVTADDLLRFGYMPEQRGLYPRMPIGRQLRYLGRLHGMSSRDAEAATRRWLADLGLADRIGDRVNQLSHGNQQRVQLAAALLHDPELLVLDEPFGGLDPLGVEAMSATLRALADAGATVVFSSHQLDLVEELCDDVVIIAAGRDRIAGTLAEVRAASGTHRVRIRLAGGGGVTPPPGTVLLDVQDGVHRLAVPADTDARAFLTQVDGAVERFSLEPPRLTEVFRDVVGAGVEELEADAGVIS